MFKSLLIFLSILYSTAIFSAEKRQVIPPEFVGKWAGNIKDCASHKPLNLSILPKRLKYWESTGSAVAIVVKEKSELALIVELSGEGSQWLSFVHFRLSSDKKRLKDITDPAAKKKLVRVRCPGK